MPGEYQSQPPELLADSLELSETDQDSILLGIGGMGEVWRVRDPRLQRSVALKVLRADQLGSASARARFIAEARLTAQLQHPGIVPVHELGTLRDGRDFFTMKEVSGRTLADVLEEARTPGTWSLARLVELLRRASEAVAYAHARGILHCDLKPANVLVGEFGEVLVVDWGLARTAAPTPAPLPAAPVGPVVGTPAYMSPEQALGVHEGLSPACDVWSLGAILHEILAGHRPYDGDDPWRLVEALRAGPPPRLVLDGRPRELLAIGERALSREPADRYAHASELAWALSAWLEGAQRRDEALALVHEAEALLPEAAERKAKAARLRAAAADALSALPEWAPEAEKQPAWALGDEADRLERGAELLLVRAIERFQAALTRDNVAEAHAGLATLYRERHRAAEALREPSAAGWALLLRSHDTGTHAAYLRGAGAVTLVTDPAGATIELFRYATIGRREVPVRAGEFGPTPVVEAPLAMGSWLLVLRAPGCHDVRYPVEIRRLHNWDGIRPDASTPTVIRLPRLGELAPEDIYVPPGWFRVGGDPDAASGLPAARMWADGFVLRRHPVQKFEFITFLNALLDAGREEEALRWAPRDRPTRVDVPGALLYPRGKDGRFRLDPLDSDGDPWLPSWPVFCIDRASAGAYAAWFAQATGLPWRLPHELEWEKAARGVDGRWFPWGDGFDPSRCHMRVSQAERPIPRAVGSFPLDESPYGAREMAGLIRQWCANDFAQPGANDGRIVPAVSGQEGSLASLRGGFWAGVERVCRGASRLGEVPTVRVNGIGFRVARRG